MYKWKIKVKEVTMSRCTLKIHVREWSTLTRNIEVTSGIKSQTPLTIKLNLHDMDLGRYWTLQNNIGRLEVSLPIF
jgi:hypothetical protein